MKYKYLNKIIKEAYHNGEFEIVVDEITDMIWNLSRGLLTVEDHASLDIELKDEYTVISTQKQLRSCVKHELDWYT